MFVLTATEATKVTPRFILMAFPVSRREGGGERGETLNHGKYQIRFSFFLLPLLRKIGVLLRNGQGDISCSDKSSAN